MDQKVCAVRPHGKNRGIKSLIEQGAIYGGRFSPKWGADRSGRSVVLVLRDEGDQVFAAPLEAAARARPSPRRVHVPKGDPLKYAGVVLLERACTMDKKLLDRKLGELPDDVLSAVTVAAFRAGRA